jgi:hypothetical protein
VLDAMILQQIGLFKSSLANTIQIHVGAICSMIWAWFELA